MNVSRKVSSHVSRPVSPDDERFPAKKRNLKPKSRSSGLYLVRSGSLYLFQIRMPKTIGGGTASRPLRVSLGALPHQEARRLADSLAALARTAFREIEKAMSTYKGPDLADIVSGLYDDEIVPDDWPFDLASNILKGGLYDLREAARPPTPDEAKGLELMRGLVRIGQQLSAKQAGQPYDHLIADNAEALVASHIAKDDNAVVAAKLPDQLYATTYLEPLTLPKTPPLPAPEAPSGDANAVRASGRRISADVKPAFKLDRRTVERRASTKSLFSEVASEYLALRKSSKSGSNKDIAIAAVRLNIFVELIGDHPIDTYTGTDLQAFIDLMKHWPRRPKDRPSHLTTHEILASNRDNRFQTISRKTLEEGYVAVIKSALNSGQNDHDYRPITSVRLKYPDSARPPVHTEPLGSAKLQKLFETGVGSGLIDNAMLPLLGFLTGRRLALLVHLQGVDIREKYEGVWVAQTSGIVLVNGTWRRVPIKNPASATFFVLHNFLVDIGFVQWAQAQGDRFLFSQLMKLKDPSKSASSYMARLFQEAGIKTSRGEVFHSLRSGYIAEAGEQSVEKRDRQMQVGHEIGDDEHDKYGFLSLTEKKARALAELSLSPEIDLSMFRGLDFDKLAAAERMRGRRPEVR